MQRGCSSAHEGVQDVPKVAARPYPRAGGNARRFLPAALATPIVPVAICAVLPPCAYLKMQSLNMKRAASGSRAIQQRAPRSLPKVSAAATGTEKAGATAKQVQQGAALFHFWGRLSGAP